MPPFSSIINLYCLTTWESIPIHPFTYRLLHTLPVFAFSLLSLSSTILPPDNLSSLTRLLSFCCTSFLFLHFFFLPAHVVSVLFVLTTHLYFHRSQHPPLLSSFKITCLNTFTCPTYILLYYTTYTQTTPNLPKPLAHTFIHPDFAKSIQLSQLEHVKLRFAFIGMCKAPCYKFNLHLFIISYVYNL